MSDSNDTFIINGTPEIDTVTHENVNEAKSSDEEKSSATQNPIGESTGESLNLEFNRTNIENLGNNIHLVDSDVENKLDMFCYVKCDKDDNELLKQCRGVVFNGKLLVMKAFPYTTEYQHTDTDEITKELGNFKDWTFYEAQEGALVRMFYFNGKWFLSTHRKLNAFKSKWASSESFGTSFKAALSSEEEHNPAFKAILPEGDNILDRFQSTLDINKQYMFLIRNNKNNRIVCSEPDRPIVYHVGTFINGEVNFTENVNLPFPKKMEFLNVKELQEYVETISYNDLQGVIGFTDDNRQIKILNKDYKDLFCARGNEPSIKFRYLQVRMEKNIVQMLDHLYPHMRDTFDDYENTLFEIARGIYEAYVQRFIKKSYVTVPREEFAVIRECHTWHLADRTNNRISLDQILYVLNQQTPTRLNHMIRRFKLEQLRPKEQCSTINSTENSPVIRSIKMGPRVPNLPNNNNKVFKKNNRPPPINILPRKPLYKPNTQVE